LFHWHSSYRLVEVQLFTIRHETFLPTVFGPVVFAKRKGYEILEAYSFLFDEVFEG
jgi:hypothetical protein